MSSLPSPWNWARFQWWKKYYVASEARSYGNEVSNWPYEGTCSCTTTAMEKPWVSFQWWPLWDLTYYHWQPPEIQVEGHLDHSSLKLFSHLTIRLSLLIASDYMEKIEVIFIIPRPNFSHTETIDNKIIIIRHSALR